MTLDKIDSTTRQLSALRITTEKPQQSPLTLQNSNYQKEIQGQLESLEYPPPIATVISQYLALPAFVLRKHLLREHIHHLRPGFDSTLKVSAELLNDLRCFKHPAFVVELQHTRLNVTVFQQVIASCANAVELNLSSCQLGQLPFDADGWVGCVARMQQLQVLHISHHAAIPANATAAFKTMPQLRTIVAKNCGNSAAFAQEMRATCPQIEVITEHESKTSSSETL